MMSLSTVCAALLALLLTLNVANGNRTARQASRCGGGTTCVPLHSCPAMQELLRIPTRENLQKIQRALCSTNRRNPMVCCASATPTPTPTPTPLDPGSGEKLLPSVCGLGHSSSRIFNGENVPLGAYPWNAVLGYNTTATGELDWGCGGVVINSRYIVTAAHCVAANLPLQEIRLGEHHLDTIPDCRTVSGEQICAPPHQSFTVTRSQIIAHPGYNTRVPHSDDIALIRLDRPVVFNDFLQPICLPPNPTFDSRTFLGVREAIVSGWGHTEEGPKSRILKRVQIPFIELQQCQSFYNNLLIPEQLCFGGVGKRDSCNGDSGGPVFQADTSDFRNILIGIVSYGKQCGGDPAVYTNVASYRSWILQNLRP